MAEVIDDFLKNITAPALNEANYGAHVGTQFENIDDNFKKIVGTDFLKGIPGDSIILKEVDFTETSWDEILYLKIPRPEGSFHQFRPKDLKESIQNAIKYNIGSNLGTWQIENALSTIPKDSNEYDITPISYTESLTYNTKITLICAIDEETGKRYVVSSLPYIFYDARFYNKNISYEVLNDYNDIVDTSCVIYFDKNKFSLGEDWGKNVDTVIDSLDELKTHCMSAITTFPTLYYDQDTIYDESSNSDGSKMGTFCWKINGHYTGIPANGPKGPKGNSDTGYIVRVSNYSSNKFGATGKKLHPVVSVMIDTGTNENPDVRFVKIDDIINGLDINGNKLYEGVNLQEGALTVAFKSVNDNNYIDVVDNNIQYNVTIKNNDNYRPVNILMDNERWNIIWKFTFNNGLDASEYVEIDGINAKNYITKNQVASSLDKYTFAIKTLCLDTINVSVYPEKVRYSADVETPNDIYNEDVYGYDGYSTYIDQRLNGYQFSIVYDKEDPVKNIEIDYNDPKMTTPIYKLANPVLYNISISKNGVPCVGDYALKWTFKYFDSVTGESGEIGYNAYEEYAEDYDGTMSNKSTAERLIKSHYNHSSGKWVIENQLDMDVIAEAIPMNYQDKFDPIVIYLTEKKGKNKYGEPVVYDLAGYDIIDYIKTEYSNYDNDSFVDKCWISPLVQYTYIDSDGKERKEFYVECDDYNSIINTFEAHAMLNYMRSFGKSASNPGLFLPIENYSQEISYVNEEPTLKGHLLFAEKSARKDMIIAPLDNVLKSDSEIKTALSDKDNSLSIWHNDVYIGKHSVEGIENVKGYGNNLHVAGDTELKKRLNVYGNTNLRNTLYIGNSDDDKLNSYIDVNGNAGFRGVLGVMKNGIFNGMLYANQGIQSAKTIYIGNSDNNKYNSYIDEKGNAGLTGSLTVIQESTFNGPLYANKGVNINSRANINGEVNIVGPVSIEMKYNEDADGYGEGTTPLEQTSLSVNGIAKFNNKLIAKNIMPSQTGEKSIGDANNRWNNIWVNTINCKKLTIEGQDLDSDLNKTQKIQIVSDVSDEVIAEISSKNNNAYLSVTGSISYKDQYGETVNMNTMSSVPLSSIISLLLPSGDVVTETPDKCYKLNLTGSSIMDAVDPRVRFEVYDEITKTWKSDSEAGYSLTDIKFTVIDGSGNIINNGFITDNWNSSSYHTWYDLKPGQSVFVNVYINKPIRFTIVATNSTMLQARQTRITFAESLDNHMSHNLVTYGSIGELSFNATSSTSYMLP